MRLMYVPHVATTMVTLKSDKWEGVKDSAGAPKTPSKRRKLYSAVTPRSKSVTATPQQFITPTAKRCVPISELKTWH